MLQLSWAISLSSVRRHYLLAESRASSHFGIGRAMPLRVLTFSLVLDTDWLNLPGSSAYQRRKRTAAEDEAAESRLASVW